jgi:hypothetical protein
LGGKHERNTLFSSPGTAHFCGSPQGREPAESGPHGCTLVDVDEALQVRTTPVATDVIRWLQERIVVDQRTTAEDLETLLRERMHTLVETIPGIDLMVSWTVSGSGPILGRLRRGSLAADLLERLRREYGFGPPAAWSVSLESEAEETLPADWYQQQTIRGDFLRAVQHLETHPSEPLGLEAYLTESQLAGPLGAAAVDGKVLRDDVLREVTMLGVDLLSGREPQP